MAIAHAQHDLYDVAGDGTLSFNVTHPGGSNVVMVVSMFWNQAYGDLITAETYNAGAGTLIGQHNRVNLYLRQSYWINPAAGTNAVAFSADQQSANTAIVVAVDWFTGVHQTTPVVGAQDTSTGAWTTPSHTLSPGSGDRLFMSTVGDNPSLAWPSGSTNVTLLTDRGHDTTQSSCGGITGYTTVDAYATIGYAAAVTTNWASAAIVLADTGVAGPYVPGPYNLRRRGRMAA